MHPVAEERLHAELKTVLDGRVPTVDDVRKLTYTEMVLSESLRLYPPAWVIGREAKRDTTIGSYQVPKGSVPLMSQYVMHRDPRYFSEPERFDPDRWRPESRARLPSFAYFPFGGGSRACIGEPFALMEGVLALATIAQNWKLRLVPGHRIELAPRITLRPKYGMMMTVSKRNVSTAQPAEKEPGPPLLIEPTA
jgi:cytochrome P450